MKHGMMITAGSFAAALLLGGCQPETQAEHRQPERPVLVVPEEPG